MATLKPGLDDQVGAIRSRADLVAFVRDLALDFRARPGDWENQAPDAYLEALAAWLEDMDGYYRNRGEAIPQEPSWKTLGEALIAAKVYE